MEERKHMMISMNNIIISLNNEDAYYEWINIIPDNVETEELYDIATDNELFNDVTKLFMSIIKRYIKDGLYIDGELY